MGRDDGSQQALVLSSNDYFSEVVTDAFERRKLKTLPMAKTYLVGMLESYIPTENLFDTVDASGRKTQATLAETFLKAQSSETSAKIELLKRLADRSLYISGFFGDSLQRKLIDVDYYADMGCTAYASLADCVREDTVARMYREFADRFLEFVDVLTDISTQAHVFNEDNLMRLFELYARTGSDVAREKLMEKGLIGVSAAHLPLKKQQ